MALPLRQPTAAPAGSPWGSRARIGATIRDLDDILGNRDGLWDNETGPRGVVAGGLRSRPSVTALRAAAATGLHTRDEQARLAAALAECEQAWGAKVSRLAVEALPGGQLYAVQKALLLARWGRHPAELRDSFVRAVGRVDDQDIAEREIFVRELAPSAPPSGAAVLLVPGHAVGARGAMAQAMALSARGHRVFLMEHQWSAVATGTAGALDSGFGLVRDLAAVVAAIQDHVQPARLGLLAHSVGAGVAAVGTLVFQAAGRIELEGPPLPSALPTVLESPWLGAGWHFCAEDSSPEAARVRAPAIVPLAGSAATVAARATQLVVLEGAGLPGRWETRVEPCLKRVLTLIADGVRPRAPVCVVHAEHDGFADLQLTRHLASALDASLELRQTDNHLLCLDPDHQLAAVDALQGLLAPGAPAVHRGSTAPFGAARDRTLRFTVLAARAAAGERVLPEDAQEYAYLTVPGLFTERYPGYMRAKFGRMAELGLVHALVPVDTDAGVESNAEAVRDAVLGMSDKSGPVVLLGHSKGGVDIAAALGMFPELQRRVHAVVTLQAPWLGTPIGDLVQDQAVLSWANRFIVEGAFRGEATALTGLGVRARQEFIARYPWPESMPAVCLATSLRSWSTLLRVPDALLAQSHGPTDGLVPMAHAVLPGADAVFLRDVDHGGPVLPRPLGTCAHLDPGDVTAALIALALERAAGR